MTDARESMRPVNIACKSLMPGLSTSHLGFRAAEKEMRLNAQGRGGLDIFSHIRWKRVVVGQSLQLISQTCPILNPHLRRRGTRRQHRKRCLDDPGKEDMLASILGCIWDADKACVVVRFTLRKCFYLSESMGTRVDPGLAPIIGHYDESASDEAFRYRRQECRHQREHFGGQTIGR